MFFQLTRYVIPRGNKVHSGRLIEVICGHTDIKTNTKLKRLKALFTVPDINERVCITWVNKPQNYKDLYGILQLLRGSHLIFR